MIAGADGYRKQWIVVSEAEGDRMRIELLPDFETVIAVLCPEILVIDVPIGLHDAGRRACDVEARRLLGPRHNSVFTAPIRPMLIAESWEEAAAIRSAVEGKRCSRQLFGILPLIRSVDARMSPALQERIREGHPEVSFTFMSGTPMAHHKSRAAGRAERLELLRHEFTDLDQRIAGFGRPGAVTDILDACALLWTARRVRDGTCCVLPAEPEVDPRGLRAEIVA
jgi:predicted RNase H-like nuclease